MYELHVMLKYNGISLCYFVPPDDACVTFSIMPISRKYNLHFSIKEQRNIVITIKANDGLQTRKIIIIIAINSAEQLLLILALRLAELILRHLDWHNLFSSIKPFIADNVQLDSALRTLATHSINISSQYPLIF